MWNKQRKGKTETFSFTARWRSVGHAINGLRCLLRSEHNARIHLASAVGAVLAGWWLHLNAMDWRWITLAVALVWCSEAINTAIEFMCDVVSPEYHRSVEKAKDISAGAVLICACAAVVIGCLTFWPYVIR